jgi:hypothetical protein
VLPERTFVFVSATEPLAAAQAAWSSPQPIDLCVTAPSEPARETGEFACAGRPVRIVEEPLLNARWPGEDEVGQAARRAARFERCMRSTRGVRSWSGTRSRCGRRCCPMAPTRSSSKRPGCSTPPSRSSATYRFPERKSASPGSRSPPRNRSISDGGCSFAADPCTRSRRAGAACGHGGSRCAARPTATPASAAPSIRTYASDSIATSSTSLSSVAFSIPARESAPHRRNARPHTELPQSAYVLASPSTEAAATDDSSLSGRACVRWCTCWVSSRIWRDRRRSSSFWASSSCTVAHC